MATEKGRRDSGSLRGRYLSQCLDPICTPALLRREDPLTGVGNDMSQYGFILAPVALLGASVEDEFNEYVMSGLSVGLILHVRHEWRRRCSLWSFGVYALRRELSVFLDACQSSCYRWLSGRLRNVAFFFSISEVCRHVSARVLLSLRFVCTAAATHERRPCLTIFRRGSTTTLTSRNVQRCKHP